LEEIGKEYYDELIQRNLIELDISYDEKVVCNMHMMLSAHLLNTWLEMKH